jgi:hypothetical protein
MDGSQWLVKFSQGEDLDTELLEHASMRLAAQCGFRLPKRVRCHCPVGMRWRSIGLTAQMQGVRM